jgi:hypothetical protein
MLVTQLFSLEKSENMDSLMQWPFVVYSVVANMSSAESYGHQPQPTPLEKLITQNEVTSISLPAPVSPVTQALELAKGQNIVQQGPQYPYVPTVSNYHGFGLMPQISGGQQYAYEPTDSQPDVPHLPSLMVSIWPCFK